MWRIVRPDITFIIVAIVALILIFALLCRAWIRFRRREAELLAGAERHAVGQMMSPVRRALFLLCIFVTALFTAVGMVGLQRQVVIERPLRETTGIVFLLDCSRSILAEQDVFDENEGRLGSVKSVAQSILRNIDPGYMIAVVPFAGDAAPAALSSDYATILPILDSNNRAIGPHQFTNQGTDIALALHVGIELLELVPELEEKVLILISDGEVDRSSGGVILPSDIQKAVRRARDEEFTIFTIAVGTPEPSPRPFGWEPAKIPDSSSDDGWYRETTGGPIMTTTPSPELMREIVRLHRGVRRSDPIIDQYFRSSDNPLKLAIDMQSFFARIEASSVRLVTEWQSYEGILVIAALFFLFGSVVARQGFPAKRPSTSRIYK